MTFYNNTGTRISGEAFSEQFVGALRGNSQVVTAMTKIFIVTENKAITKVSSSSSHVLFACWPFVLNMSFFSRILRFHLNNLELVAPVYWYTTYLTYRAYYGGNVIIPGKVIIEFEGPITITRRTTEGTSTPVTIDTVNVQNNKTNE